MHLLCIFLLYSQFNFVFAKPMNGNNESSGCTSFNNKNGLKNKNIDFHQEMSKINVLKEQDKSN